MWNISHTYIYDQFEAQEMWLKWDSLKCKIKLLSRERGKKIWVLNVCLKWQEDDDDSTWNYNSIYWSRMTKVKEEKERKFFDIHKPSETKKKSLSSEIIFQSRLAASVVGIHGSKLDIF